jgi:hypothetical protein
MISIFRENECTLKLTEHIRSISMMIVQCLHHLKRELKHMKIESTVHVSLKIAVLLREFLIDVSCFSLLILMNT